MKCLYCQYEGPRTELHFHLIQEHGDKVVTGLDEEQQKMFYEIQCPVCSKKLVKTVNPRGRDQSFIDEFAYEIRMVAFDRLLLHLETDHVPGKPPISFRGGPQWR